MYDIPLVLLLHSNLLQGGAYMRLGEESWYYDHFQSNIWFRYECFNLCFVEHSHHLHHHSWSVDCYSDGGHVRVGLDCYQNFFGWVLYPWMVRVMTSKKELLKLCSLCQEKSLLLQDCENVRWWLLELRKRDCSFDVQSNHPYWKNGKGKQNMLNHSGLCLHLLLLPLLLWRF